MLLATLKSDLDSEVVERELGYVQTVTVVVERCDHGLHCDHMDHGTHRHLEIAVAWLSSPDAGGVAALALIVFTKATTILLVNSLKFVLDPCSPTALLPHS